MSEKKPAWKGTTGGGNFGQRALLLLFRYVDIRVGYAILGLVIPFYMIFNQSGYKAIKDYFRRIGYKGNVNYHIYRNHYLFGQMMMDKFYLFARKKNIFKSRVTDWDQFTELLKGKGGFLISGAHAGNFEICGYFLQQRLKKLNAVVFGGESAFMQENRASALSGNMAELIPVSPDMSHLFTIKSALEKGEMVSMPSDRLFGSTKSFSFPFLGSPANFPMGSFLLAAQLDVPMVSLYVMRERGMKYHIICKQMSVDRSQYRNSREIARALCQAYVEQLENVLKSYPHQWFNFYDFWNNNTV
ncbi:MAG TPA: lipid A biosynthesis (KDO)2-(lauroyl)-lipid IVA acyltransferase [Bacteroidales bacterium]|nr:lipid A biosynthesis (KDO)2-(lauroyl)-lipid IVA acyltransferase [Bacteroidales bacterium]HOR10702.1 lipid A biosynthesis (KDO)2-(lauroyl)-lipid IVA acyltransferase [Bacteroidales bacterium]HPJ82804.1 lipid A biosynthesis (KDO)2-(lauroyl)-lipid IVA acyltransferase [Bacteroidales bacterium]HPK39457.1 lipid A biosynthesis (KDO)2-(lauroyl)-lipid IVA acyltransferase [Bacteroidales bacterium]